MSNYKKTNAAFVYQTFAQFFTTKNIEIIDISVIYKPFLNKDHLLRSKWMMKPRSTNFGESGKQ